MQKRQKLSKCFDGFEGCYLFSFEGQKTMAPPRLRDDSWRIFGVEFVSPLVSRERKLQTVAVATYMYLFLLLPSATIVTLYYLYFYTR